MEKVVKFDYMRKDEVISHVEINTETGEVKYEDFFTSPPHWSAFGIRPRTIETVLWFFETRCFPRTRYNADQILADWGMTQYNPYDIVKYTHGCMIHDFFWIRFEGEKLTWADVDVKTKALERSRRQ